MLKILGRPTSINVQKVMWCAAELGIEVNRVDIGGPHGGNDTPEYLAKNPNGLVPTLEDGDFVLWESNAIVRYLAETQGQAPWFPAEANGRALASQWMDWYLTIMHPPMMVIFLTLIRTAPEDRDENRGDRGHRPARRSHGRALPTTDTVEPSRPSAAPTITRPDASVASKKRGAPPSTSSSPNSKPGSARRNKA